MVVGGALAAWFTLGALVQVPHRVCKRVRRLDPVGHLLPGWNFFATKPIEADLEVWYRGWHRTGDCDELVEGGWTRLDGLDNRGPLSALVHPRKRVKKVAYLACHRLLVAGKAGADRNQLMLSVPYLVLLGRISPLAGEARAVQFRIDVVTYPCGRPQRATGLVSGIHWTSAAPAAPEPLAA
jgi:hypothetical protein